MYTLDKKGPDTKIVLTRHQVQVSVPTNSSACLTVAAGLCVLAVLLKMAE